MRIKFGVESALNIKDFIERKVDVAYEMCRVIFMGIFFLMFIFFYIDVNLMYLLRSFFLFCCNFSDFKPNPKYYSKMIRKNAISFSHRLAKS